MIYCMYIPTVVHTICPTYIAIEGSGINKICRVGRKDLYYFRVRMLGAKCGSLRPALSFLRAGKKIPKFNVKVII